MHFISAFAIQIPAAFQKQSPSFIAWKQFSAAAYPAQVSYFSIQEVYAAFTEQVLPSILISLQYDAVRLVPVTVLQLPLLHKL